MTLTVILFFAEKKAEVLCFLFVWSFSVSQADGILLDLWKTLEGPDVYPQLLRWLRSARRNLSSMSSSHIPSPVWSQRPGHLHTQHVSYLRKCQDGMLFSRNECFMSHPHRVCLILLDNIISESILLLKIKCYLYALFYLLFLIVCLFNRASYSQN